MASFQITGIGGWLCCLHNITIVDVQCCDCVCNNIHEAMFSEITCPTSILCDIPYSDLIQPFGDLPGEDRNQIFCRWLQ